MKVPNPLMVERISANADRSAIAAPVWHELVFGSRRLPSGKRRKALESYLNDVVLASFAILPYDEAAATWHGVERYRLARIGRPAPYVDGQIAAIAKSRELTLVTANVKDFAGFRDISVEDWSRP